MATAPTDLDDADGELPSASSSSGGSSSTETPADSGSDDEPDAVEVCGGHLQHISQAGEFLLDAEEREAAPHADELDRDYRRYVEWMRQRNLDPADGRNEVSEFEDETPGRKSKVLDELGFPGSENDPPPD